MAPPIIIELKHDYLTVDNEGNYSCTLYFNGSLLPADISSKFYNGSNANLERATFCELLQEQPINYELIPGITPEKRYGIKINGTENVKNALKFLNEQEKIQAVGVRLYQDGEPNNAPSYRNDLKTLENGINATGKAIQAFGAPKGVPHDHEASSSSSQPGIDRNNPFYKMHQRFLKKEIYGGYRPAQLRELGKLYAMLESLDLKKLPTVVEFQESLKIRFKETPDLANINLGLFDISNPPKINVESFLDLICTEKPRKDIFGREEGEYFRARKGLLQCESLETLRDHFLQYQNWLSSQLHRYDLEKPATKRSNEEIYEAIHKITRGESYDIPNVPSALRR